MNKRPKYDTSINRAFKCESYEGESIEQKMTRINLTDAIEDDPNLQKIYTMRKDGVRPEYNVRADKWDIALNALDEANKTKIAKAEAYTKETENPTQEETKTE